MKLGNTRQAYGVISIGLHWLMALLVIGLFLLGIYMTDLDYYHPWYQSAPDIHRSVGIITLVLLLLRLLWRLVTVQPEPVGKDSRLLQRLAAWVHWSFYLLLIAIPVSGYLISTADGRGIDLFGWFTVPALLPPIANLEDSAGEVHWLLALFTMILVGVHSLAALKHHFIDRDTTLMRMLGSSRHSTD